MKDYKDRIEKIEALLQKQAENFNTFHSSVIPAATMLLNVVDQIIGELEQDIIRTDEAVKIGQEIVKGVVPYDNHIKETYERNMGRLSALISYRSRLLEARDKLKVMLGIRPDFSPTPNDPE